MSQPPGLRGARLARLALGGRDEAPRISNRRRLRIGSGSFIRLGSASGQSTQRRRALDFAFDLAALPSIPPGSPRASGLTLTLVSHV
jgi:hypothetical protein